MILFLYCILAWTFGMVVQAGKCWCISACPTVLWCWSSGRRPYQAMKKRFENLRKMFLKTTWNKNRENESLLSTQTSSCHMATESQTLVFAQFHRSCLTSPTSTEKRLQGSFIDEGRKTRKKFQQEEPLKQCFPPIKKMRMVDTAMLISVEEWDSIYIYTYKSRVAVHQRFRGSKEF